MTCEVCQPLVDREVVSGDEDVLCPCEAEDSDSLTEGDVESN